MDAETRPCDACRQPIPATARFCQHCGAPVADRQRPEPSDGGGENRQLTVMFCDLVDSTALSDRLDAEDLRDVIRSYQEACADAVESYGGTIGQYLGDGVLAYFGYPLASESAAIHAADAALDIVRAAQKRSAEALRRYGAAIDIRIALHTGRVLIGEMGAGQTRDRHALIGAAPNLAARLEGIAPINGVAISDRTAALVSRAFDLESLGRHSFKGLSEPVEAFRVLRRRWSVSVLPERTEPLMGRDDDLRVLRDAWEAMGAAGNRRLTVVGEPGMGKSSLAAAFLAGLGIGETRILQIAGTLRDRNTPFACLRRSVELWADLGAMHGARSADEQIARWYGTDGPEAAEHARTIQRLLTGTGAGAGEGVDGREERARVIAACRARIEGMPKPVLLVGEDAHWIDPSTAEMMVHVVETVPGVMLLRLKRPDEGGVEADDAGSIVLDRLDPAACRALIETVAGGPVEAELARRITSVSGGLPLFVEEFTKSLIESGAVQRVRGTMRPALLHASVATPSSILDMITVRLDALGPARALAQVCAVLGRSFDRAALVAVSGQPEVAVDETVERLIDMGLLTREWSGRLTFRHALFQAAAYESLLRSERRACHARFLDWVQARPERCDAVPPDTRAFHLEACGREDEAVACYMEAGEMAERASASFEAVTHYRKSCDLVAACEAGGLGDLRLKAQVKLAAALLSARGGGAIETRDAYDAAVALAEDLPESDWHFPAYWGWWRVSDSFATMAARGAELVERSAAMQGLEFKLQAQHCRWATAFQVGDLDASIDSARAGLALYDRGRFDEGATHYGGHDCKVCALGEIGLARWLQGAGDAAVAPVEEAVAHAERLGHLGSLLHALDIAVMLHHYRRDTASALTVAKRMIALAEKNDLDEYCAKGEIFSGWVAVEGGAVREGLARIDAGHGLLEEIGTPEDFPVYQSIRAQAFNRLGDADAARAALRKGEEVIAVEGVNYWGAEIARVRALIEMAAPEPDAAAIAEALDEADARARDRGLLALELRAGLTRCEWLHGADRPLGAALEALSAVRGRFDAGAAGRDLAAADAMVARVMAP